MTREDKIAQYLYLVIQLLCDCRYDELDSSSSSGLDPAAKQKAVGMEEHPKKKSFASGAALFSEL